MTNNTENKKLPNLIAYHVTKDEKTDKSYWQRIGAAWKHEDNKGLTLKLDLMPIGNGEITLRVPKESEQQ